MQKVIKILKSFDLFSALHRDELKKIADISEEVSFGRGEVIVKENMPAGSLFILKDGCVKITKDGKLIVMLGKGNPIGELSFIDNGLPSATATAEEDSVLIKIPSRAFYKMMKQDKDIAGKVYRSIALSLCQKLRDTNEWLFTKEWLADIEKEAVSRRLV